MILKYECGQIWCKNFGVRWEVLTVPVDGAPELYEVRDVRCAGCHCSPRKVRE